MIKYMLLSVPEYGEKLVPLQTTGVEKCFLTFDCCKQMRILLNGELCLHILSSHSRISSAFTVTFPDHKCIYQRLENLHRCTEYF